MTDAEYITGHDLYYDWVQYEQCNYKYLNNGDDTNKSIMRIDSYSHMYHPSWGGVGYYFDVTTLSIELSQTQGELIETVSSTNSSTYPSDGISGDFYYIKR